MDHKLRVLIIQDHAVRDTVQRGVNKKTENAVAPIQRNFIN